jgi:DNA-binding NtrC family response regulator
VGNVKKTVIIIDDDKSILRTFTKVLLKNRYKVDVAENGEEALEKLSKQTYDVALIDLKLPDLDGTDILLLKKERLLNTAKILITGLSSADNGAKAVSYGAGAYLTKPVKPEDLLAVIEEKLKNKKS